MAEAGARVADQLEPLQLALQGTNSDLKLRLLSALSATLQSASPADLPPDTTEQLLLLLKLALKSSNTHHVTAALASLPLLFPLLVPDPVPEHQHGHLAHTLKHAFLAVLPVSHLGDQKERVRELAREGIVSAARTALRLGIAKEKEAREPNKEGPWAYLSRCVHEQGFASKNPKAREQARSLPFPFALHYLLAIRSSPPSIPLPPLRPFTPLLIALLSDPDPAVRTLSFSTTTAIFTAPSTTPAAKADLKKALAAAEAAGQVTKKVADTLVAAVLSAGAGNPMDRSSSSGSLVSERRVHSPSQSASESATTTSPRPRAVATSSAQAPSLSSSSATPATTSALPPVPPSQSSEIPLVYLASTGDLASEFVKMEPGFAGKETEFNWIERDRSISRIRGMVKAGVATGPFAEPFLAHFKAVLDGVLKTASSLRTTVAVSALTLISELSVAFGHALDPLLDPLLSHCLSMAGQTKKIVAAASQASAKALITNANYHLRTLQLLQLGMADKIASARAYISAHLIVFVDIHGVKHKHSIEITGGLPILEACLKKGLADANSTVKENSRQAFWAVEAIWPQMGEAVIKALDAPTRKQLEKADPRGKVAAVLGGATKAARPSVRALIAAKAKQATGDEGPNSAPGSPLPSPRASTSRPTTATSPRRPPGPISSSITPAARLPPPLVPLPNSPPSPPTPTQAEVTPTAAAPVEVVGDDLLRFTSPFVVDDADSSLDFASRSSGSIPDRPRNGSLVFPVPDPTVDDAMREQAAQAEQAAQRLLELAESDAEVDDATTAGPLGPGGQPLVDSVRERTTTPLPHFQRTPAKRPPPVASDVFEDSPDVGNNHGGGGTGRGNWWMKKADLGLPHPPLEPLAPDSDERLTEIASLVSALQTVQIDVGGLRELSALSRERPVLEDRGEDEPASKNAARFWDSGRRFVKVFAGVTALLKTERASARKDGALLLFKELVQNQYPCFAGDEMEVYDLLFDLREDPSRTTVAAVDAIADTFCGSLEPLYGLGLLRSSLESYLARPRPQSPATELARAKAYALGLKLLGKFFARLPSEVLEEELPKAKALIKAGLNDAHSGDLRRAAVTALVDAQSVLQDEERLYLMIDGLAKDQMNLLSYYIERAKVKP